ncbi:MAG: pectate lyase [Proteobacteria bacterium]|nr:pectate lyase [Pseudomonadota bacterium]
MIFQGIARACSLALSLVLGCGLAQAATGGFSSGVGSTATGVTVTTLAELKSAFNAGQHHIIISGTIYGGSTLTTLTFASTSWNNTTIEGASGGKAVLENIQLKFSGEQLSTGTNIQNIVVKNITFKGRIADLQALPKQIAGTSNNIGVNYLGVSLRRVTNAWIDHCTFYDISDDLISVALLSDNVTLSYNHFYFTAAWRDMSPDPVWNWVGTDTDLAGERLAMVIGANKSDSYTYGGNKLHVTMHHNWFGPNMRGRPLVRGWVHAYNNYFDNTGKPSGTITATNGVAYSKQQYNAFQIGSGSIIYSESNYYYLTNNSNQVGLDSSTDAYTFKETNNYYNGVTGTKVTGASFSGSPVGAYTYTLDSVQNVPTIVQANVGPK